MFVERIHDKVKVAKFTFIREWLGYNLSFTFTDVINFLILIKATKKTVVMKAHSRFMLKRQTYDP